MVSNMKEFSLTKKVLGAVTIFVAGYAIGAMIAHATKREPQAPLGPSAQSPVQAPMPKMI